jgi:hypothetical protein
MMVSLRPLTLDDFSHRVGKPIEVEAGGRRVKLLLAAAQGLPESGRQGGSFRLEFFGRPDAPLGQGGFLFLIGEERFNIFVVPLGPTPRGMRYEAIFY